MAIKNSNSVDAAVELRRHQSAYDRAYSAGHDDRCKNAEINERYVFGDQWEKEDKDKMENKGPTLTINRTLSTVSGVYAEYNSMASDVTLQPRNDAAVDTATTLSKTIKFVLQNARYDSTRDQQSLTALVTGAAFVRMVLDDRIDPSGEVTITPMDSNFVVLSPDVKQYDPDSWPEVFYFSWMTEEEIAVTYGAGVAANICTSRNSQTEGEMWRYRNTLGDDKQAAFAWQISDEDYEFRVVTREFKKFRNVWVFGEPASTEYEVIPCDKMTRAEARSLAKQHKCTLTKTKQEHIYMVTWCGDTALNGNWSPYKHYTIYPMFCYFMNGHIMGIVDNLRSPQDMLNKAESQEVRVVNSVTSGGWMVEENALVNMTEEELEERGSETGLVLVHRKNSKAPEKIQPTSIPTGLSEIGQKASGHMREIVGMLPIGAEKSGKLLDSKRAVGQAVLQWPIGNLQLGEEFLVRGILDIIQEYFTEERVIRITDDKTNSVETLHINTEGENNRYTSVNVGRFSVRMVRKPRQDAVEDYELEEMVRLREAGCEIPQWMMLEKTHLSNKKELVAAARQAAGLDQTPEQQQMAQLLQQMQIESAKAELELKKQEVLELQAKTAKLMAEANAIAGQPQMQQAQQQHEMQLAGVNAALRSNLSTQSNNARIASTLMANEHGKNIAEIQGRNSLMQTVMSENNKAAMHDRQMTAQEQQSQNNSQPTKEGANNEQAK